MNCYDSLSKDKEIPRGDSRSYLLTPGTRPTGTTTESQPISFVGSTVIFEMRGIPEGNKSKITDAVVVSKTSDNINEIELVTIDDGSEGGRSAALLKIDSADTEYLAVDSYSYRVKMVTPGGLVYTIGRGVISIL